MLLKILYSSFLQMENLIFLFISLSQQNENKHREFKLPPFWRLVACGEQTHFSALASPAEKIRNLGYLVPRAFNKFARGLSLRTHFAAVSDKNTPSRAHADRMPICSTTLELFCAKKRLQKAPNIREMRRF